MKKFNFTLQKVLDYKTQSCELLIGELHNLLTELSKLEEALKQAEDEYNQRAESTEAEITKGISIQDLAIQKSYINLLLRKITEFETKKINFESVIEKKKDEILSVKSEISGLEKLKEKQLKEYNRETRKIIEADIEEYIVRNSG